MEAILLLSLPSLPERLLGGGGAGAWQEMQEAQLALRCCIVQGSAEALHFITGLSAPLRETKVLLAAASRLDLSLWQASCLTLRAQAPKRARLELEMILPRHREEECGQEGTPQKG